MMNNRRISFYFVIVASFALCTTCFLEGDIDEFLAKAGKEYIGNSFIVTFNKNGGDTEANPQTKTVTLPATTIDTLPIPPTMTGYVFNGWNTLANGSGDVFTATTTVKTNITVYAQWWSIQPVTIEMVWIPAGTFEMGSPATEPGRNDDETQHWVTLSHGFYMGKYQVTQEQYHVVMGNNPSYFRGDNRPVEGIRWYEAIVFCNRLSMAEGLSPAYKISGSTDPTYWGTVPITSNEIWNAVTIVPDSTGYRLPTEAQWEYACRAGTTTAYNTGTYMNTDTGWYNLNSNDMTHEVGLKLPNAWGLYDMHGNVWEWCWDWYGTYMSGTQINPMGASSGTARVFRGGSWRDTILYVRSASRDRWTPNSRSGEYQAVGFRLSRPIAE